MPTLTNSQIEALRNKGLDDEKIKALALQKGYDMPKGSFLGDVGRNLIKSETRFGQSIAGALGDTLLGGTKKEIEISNRLTEQVKNNTIAAIKQKRAEGKDVTNLLNALKTLDKEVNFYDILNANTGGSLDKTGKQIFGEALGVGTDIIGVGALPGAVSKVAKAKTFGQGFVQGAKTGAIGGGTFGAAEGATNAAEENKTGGEIIGSGIRGGGQGAVFGGIFGGAVGGVSGAIAGRHERLLNKQLDYTLDLVAPKITTKVAQEAGEQGRVTAPGKFSKSKILPSRRDIAVADAVSDSVRPGMKPTEAVDSIKRNVAEINNGVKGMLSERNVPFSADELATRFKSAKDDVKLIFASDRNAERTYNAVVDEFMKHVKGFDTEGLFDARQAFDKIPSIRKLLQSEGLGENVRKTIVTEVRSTANEYVASLLPANNPYRYLLLQESKMIEAIGNIASKNIDTIGKNKIQLLLQEYPWMKYILYGVGTGAAVTGFNKITGSDGE